ncbi:MAG TPA: hypothetical protein VES60_15820 [Nakamurella sp.]|nr:hypothetical protein [Nakamurella sp.]
MTSTEISEQDITALIARWSEAAQLYMDGDLRAYAAIARHAPVARAGQESCAHRGPRITLTT